MFQVPDPTFDLYDINAKRTIRIRTGKLLKNWVGVLTGQATPIYNRESPLFTLCFEMVENSEHFSQGFVILNGQTLW